MHRRLSEAIHFGRVGEALSVITVYKHRANLVFLTVRIASKRIANTCAMLLVVRIVYACVCIDIVSVAIVCKCICRVYILSKIQVLILFFSLVFAIFRSSKYIPFADTIV